MQMDNNGESELGERRSSWFKISDSGIWERRKKPPSQTKQRLIIKESGVSSNKALSVALPHET